jgi:hypothetical protein
VTEQLEAGSPEAVALLLQRAKRLCHSAHERMAAEVKYGSGPTIRDMTREIHALEEAIDRFESGPVLPERIPYVNKTIASDGWRDGEIEEEHESFGLLQISRVQSSGSRLFGSHLERHQHYIVLTISRAKVCHGLSSDRYHPTGQLIEIALSSAQFAEAITSLNSGVGAPCTIHDVLRIRMEDVPPEAQAEHRKIREGFEERIAAQTEELRKTHADLGTIIESGKTVSKGRAKEMHKVLWRAWKTLDDSAPFIINQFRESADRVVTSAKADVEAFAQHVLARAGMAALAEGLGPKLLLGDAEVDVKKLPSGEESS